MEKRFFDFPLGYISVGRQLVDFPASDDPWGLRFEVYDGSGDLDMANKARSHVGLDFIYEVTRRPDHRDVKSPDNISDWEFYCSGARVHVASTLHSYLLTLVNSFGRVYYCDPGLNLQESNWEEGAPAKWVTVHAEELRTGKLAAWRWGDIIDVEFGSPDLIFEQ